LSLSYDFFLYFCRHRKNDVKTIFVEIKTVEMNKLFIRALVILTLSIGFSLPSFAQTYILTGKVCDDNDKQPLPGAHILPQCKTHTIGVACDIDGNYKLELKDAECIVRFQFLGYETVEKTISFRGTNAITMDIFLKSADTRLAGVEVKASRYEIKRDESVSSLELVGTKQIEDMNITSLDGAFNQVSGLVIVNNEPQMRGGSGFSSGMGSRVMIMMDEMPVMRVDAGRPAWNLIPMENVEQIEVLKGAASVLYGSSAITGAINVRTAYPKSKPETRFIWYNGFYSRPRTDYRCSWSQGTVPLTYGGSLSHARKIKKLDLTVSLEYANDDGFVGQELPVGITTEYPDFYEKIKKEERIRFNFGTRYNFREGVSVGLNGNLLYSHNTMTHFWLNADSGMYRTFPGSLTQIKDLMFFLDPYFKYFTKKESSHTVKGRFMYSDNWATNNQDAKSEMYYLEYQYAKRFKKAGDLQLFAGAVGQFARSRGNVFAGVGDSTGIIRPKYSANAAAYVQLEKKFLKKKNLTLLAGGRYEYFQIFEEFGHFLQDDESGNYVEAKPVFRAGVNYQIVRTYTSFRASFGQGYRFPTIGERYITTKVGNYGFYPNPDLKSETSWNVEGGIQQMFKLLGIQGMVDIAVYYQRYKNYVEFFFGPWLTEKEEAVPAKRYGFKYFNTGEAAIAGIDISVAGEAKIARNFEYSFYFAYTYSRPKMLDTAYIYASTLTKDYTYNNSSYNTDGQIMKYRLEHVLKADLNFTFFKLFSVGVSAQYYSMMKNIDKFFFTMDRFSSEAPRWVKESKSPFPFDYLENYYNSRDKGTWVFAFRASIELWNVKLSLIIDNIFNKEYSLRPMYAESPRVTTLQLMYKFTEGEPFFLKRKKNS
jgi:iron complex outermembrane receptor protein